MSGLSPARLWVGTIVLLLGLFLWHNTDDHTYREELRGIYALALTTTSEQDYRAAFDEHQLRLGYHKAPELWHDGAAWWHGTWIHQGTRYFRPLSSYLHWFHCWSWEHGGSGGFLWLGVVLYVPAAVLMALLARRFVQSPVYVALAAPILVFGADLSGWRTYWLAWFPGQPQFVLVAFMAASLLSFDLWLERGKTRALLSTVLFLCLACLTKEHGYILPAQLAVLALLRPGSASWRARVGTVGLFFGLIGLLYTYRSRVLPDADEPHLRPWRLLRGALSHSHWELRLPLQNEIYDIPLCALCLFGLFFLVRWLRQQTFVQAWQAQTLGRIGLVLALVIGIGLCLLPGSCGVALLDPNQSVGVQLKLLGLLFHYSQLYLTVRYSRKHGTLCPWLLLVLSNYPVGASFGWHYDITGWQFQLPYAAVLLQVLWLDVLQPRILARGPS